MATYQLRQHISYRAGQCDELRNQAELHESNANQLSDEIVRMTLGRTPTPTPGVSGAAAAWIETMAYIVMAYIAMALYCYGLDSHGSI